MRLADLIAKLPDDITVAGAMEELSRQDPVIWCMWYRRLRGQPLTYDNSKLLAKAELERINKEYLAVDAKREIDSRLLKHRPFLVEPLRDQHPHKVFEKARQVGVSELQLSEEIHFLWSHPNTKAIHTFPREKQVLDFSSTRITPAFDESARMKSLLGIPNQTSTKRIGDSFLLLRSAWESNLGEGVDADVVTLDEKDRMKDKIELAFSESLKSSKYRWMRELSTPSLPGRGIDVPFSASDQRVWMVRCERCNDEQEVVWPDNIVQVKDFPLGTTELPPGAYEFRCKKTKCRGALNRMKGRWVARYPERQLVRGYHIPQTIAPWITATGIMQDKITFKWLQPWINYVLGLPAHGESVMVSDEDFRQACAGHKLLTRRTPAWSHVSAGIDWGHLNWVVVTGKNAHNGRNYVIGIGVFEDDPHNELKSVKDIESWLGYMLPDITCADAGYGKDRNAYLLRRMSPNGVGKFWSVWYNPSTRGNRMFQPVWSNAHDAKVVIDRTMSLKITCRTIKERELGIPELGDERVALLMRHASNLAQLREIDEETKEMVESISATGDDHLMHALNYSLLGLDKLTAESKFQFSFM